MTQQWAARVLRNRVLYRWPTTGVYGDRSLQEFEALPLVVPDRSPAAVVSDASLCPILKTQLRGTV